MQTENNSKDSGIATNGMDGESYKLIYSYTKAYSLMDLWMVMVDRRTLKTAHLMKAILFQIWKKEMVLCNTRMVAAI